MNLATGERVGDRLRVDGLVSEGGSACVYRVHHEALGVVYALKILTPRSPFPAERLLREGRIQASLRHPCIVQVVDVVEVAGAQALVMEYVDGPSLAGLGALAPELVRTLFADVLAAVGAAHQHGVLHRDLKPQNILLAPVTGGWLPKVADFGIARIVEAGDTRPGVTRFGVGMGTPGYTAPEQLRDAASVDARADVYSLGVLLFELFTGHLPFGIELDAPRVQAPVSGASPAVDALLARMLDSDPDARPASVAEVAEALYPEDPRLLDIALGRSPPVPVGLAGVVRPVPVSVPSSASPPSNLTIVPDRTPAVAPAASSRLGRTIAIGVGLVAAVGLGVWVGRREPPAEPAEVAVPAAAPASPAPMDPAPPPAVPPPDDPPPAAAPAGAAPPRAPAVATPASPAGSAGAGSASAGSAAAGSPIAPEAPAVVEAAPAAPPVSAPDTPLASAPAAAVSTPAPHTPAVAAPTGEWTGTLGGRPFVVRFTGADPPEADVTLTFGVTERTTRYRGTVAADGALRLVSVDGDGVLVGTFEGGGARGTLTIGKGRPMEWRLSR